MHKSIILIVLLLLAACSLPLPAETGGGVTSLEAERHLALGNPSGAEANPRFADNYLMQRPQFVLAYNRDTGIPNWVSWHLAAQDLGEAERSNNFRPDPDLPAGWYAVTPDDYTGSGYDRGHMTPSADRTASQADNEATFVMTNIIPQAPNNNRGPWVKLENYARELVRQGNEIYIVSGGDGELGFIGEGRVQVPAATWKAMLVLPAGDDDLSRIDANTTVIAVRIPNDDALVPEGADWQDFQVSVDEIEQLTGYDLFGTLAENVQAALESGDSSDPPAAVAGPASCETRPDLSRVPDEPVRIVTIDKQAETVTLENISAAPVTLDGWLMCSLTGAQAHPGIGGSLAPGESRVFPNAGNNIWSNSDPDPGALYDAQGQIVSYYRE